MLIIFMGESIKLGCTFLLQEEVASLFFNHRFYGVFYQTHRTPLEKKKQTV